METPGSRSVPAGAAEAALEALQAASLSADNKLSGAALAALAEASEAADNPVGLPQNVTRAVELYRLAADRGNPTAQFALASLHTVGMFGVERNIPKAVTLLYFAASAGLAEAQAAMGWRHQHGRGVPKSCGTALAYLLPAAEQGARTVTPSRDAQGPDAFMVDAGSLASPGAKRDAELSRAEFIRHRGEAGDMGALRSMAVVHGKGLLGTRRDLAAARAAMEAFAEADPDGADLASLGAMLYQGLGVAEGEEDARSVGLTHLEAAVARDDKEGKAALAIARLEGLGISRPVDVRAGMRLSERPGRAEPAAVLSMRSLSPRVPGLGIGEGGAPEQAEEEAEEAAEAAEAEEAVPAARRAGPSLAIVVPGDATSEARSALRLLESAAEEQVPAAQFASGWLHARGVATSDGVSLVRRDLDKADTLFLAAGQHLHHAALLARARTVSAGLGARPSCELALASLRPVLRTTLLMDEMVAARARFERSDLLGAAAAWTRAAAMGFEVASWNLALVADRAVLAERRVLADAWAGTDAGAPSSAVAAALPAVDSALRRLSRAVFGAVGSAAAGLFVPSRGPGPAAAGSSPLPPAAEAVGRLRRAPSPALPLDAASLFPGLGREDRVRDAETACVALLDEAAGSGRIPAAYHRLAEYVQQGRGTAAGRADEAASLFRRAADLSDPSALWSLAVMHETGRGLPLDWHLAKRLFDSAERASPEARGPALVGKARLWVKSRLARLLPPALLRSLSDAAEPWVGSLMPPGSAGLELARSVGGDAAASASEASLAAIRRSAAARARDGTAFLAGLMPEMWEQGPNGVAGFALVTVGAIALTLAIWLRWNGM